MEGLHKQDRGCCAGVRHQMRTESIRHIEHGPYAALQKATTRRMAETRGRPPAVAAACFYTTRANTRVLHSVRHSSCKPAKQSVQISYKFPIQDEHSHGNTHCTMSATGTQSSTSTSSNTSNQQHLQAAACTCQLSTHRSKCFHFMCRHKPQLSTGKLRSRWAALTPGAQQSKQSQDMQQSQPLQCCTTACAALQ